MASTSTIPLHTVGGGLTDLPCTIEERDFDGVRGGFLQVQIRYVSGPNYGSQQHVALFDMTYNRADIDLTDRAVVRFDAEYSAQNEATVDCLIEFFLGEDFEGACSL